LYAPRGEREDLLSGNVDRPYPRKPSPEDATLLEELAKLILSNVDTRVDPAYLTRFSYVSEARYDHSVNQYGLLGLYSAHLCGVRISPSIWEGAAKHLIASRERPHGSIALELMSYRRWEAAKRG